MRTTRWTCLLATALIILGASPTWATTPADPFQKLLSTAQRDFHFEMQGLDGVAALLKPTLVEGMISMDYVTMLSDDKVCGVLTAALGRVKSFVDAHPKDLTYRDILDQTSVLFALAPQGVSATAIWPIGLSDDRYLFLDVRTNGASEQVEVDLYVQEHP